MTEQGWEFKEGPGTTGDRLYGHEYCISSIPTPSPATPAARASRCCSTGRPGPSSTTSRPRSSGCSTAEFAKVGARGQDYYPEPLHATIDAVNALVYEHINNGVYKAGFARRRRPRGSRDRMFRALDELTTTWPASATWPATGSPRPTSACSPRWSASIRSTSATSNATSGAWSTTGISGPARELYQLPGVADTVDFHHIKHHYYESHGSVNPTGIVPLGPLLSWHEPPGRD